MSNNTYAWIGIDHTGKKIAGKIGANHKADAQKLLLEKNITLLSIHKTHAVFSHSKKFTQKHRLDFTQQLHLLLQAGIPLSDALSLIASTSPYHTIQKMAASLRESIITGMSLSAALHFFQHDFDSTYCQLIAAGEKSDELEKVLAQLIESQEQQLHFKNKITKALFYPAGVLGVAILITMGLLIFVIPQFSSIYANFGAQLPSMTRLLISISGMITHHAITILIALAGLISSIRLASKKITTPKKILQHYLFLVPFYRSLVMTKQVSQWSQLLSITLQSGIPLSDALSIAHKAILYLPLKNQMTAVNQDVIAGKTLYASLDHCKHFPLRAKYLISAGENADALDIMMKKIAHIYKQKLDTTLDHLSKLLEPVMMIGVASLISTLIIAMYLPIFRMGSVI